MPTFPIKDWKDGPDDTTPVSAASLEDLEKRRSDHAEDVRAGAPVLAPATSARNAFTVPSSSVSAFTVKTTDGADLMTFRAGVNGSRQNLVMVSNQDRSGGFYVTTPNNSAYASLSMPGFNDNSRWPHLQMDMGVGRPADEYCYENYMALFHDGTEYFAGGFEWIDANNAHLFRWNQQLDAPVGRYFEAIDRKTSRIIFNPGGVASAIPLPYVFTALIEARSEGPAVPMLHLTGAPGQSADMIRTQSSIGTRQFSVTPNPWIFLGNSTAPGANPSGGGYLYVEAGALKYRSPSGRVTTVAPA